MPVAIQWTAEMDRALLDARAAKLSWDATGRLVGVSRNVVIERGRRLGLRGAHVDRAALLARRAPDAADDEAARADRPALPAGSAETWGAISRELWPGPMRFERERRGAAADAALPREGAQRAAKS